MYQVNVSIKKDRCVLCDRFCTISLCAQCNVELHYVVSKTLVENLLFKGGSGDERDCEDKNG